MLRNSKWFLAALWFSSAHAQSVPSGPSSGGGGSGTVTSVSVTTANGVSGSVATPTTTPAISLTLGDITPSSVRVFSSDGVNWLIGSGATTGVRFFSNGAGTFIEGVDNTGTASFQPLTIGGSTVILAASEVTKLDYGSTTAAVWTFAAPASFGTASSATGSIILANAGSAFTTTLQAGVNVTASRTYIWPTNFGAAGTVLTDAAGNGTLSWAAAGGGSPGGSSGNLQWNNSSAFAGVASSTVDASGNITLATAGALSKSQLLITGAPIATGGTATTTKPLVLIETATATSAGWNAAGTMFGVNSLSTFTGNLIDVQKNGVSQFKVTSAGTLTTTGSINGLSITAGSAGSMGWSASTVMSAPANGQMNLTNNAPSAGIGFNVSVDGTLAIRTRAQTGDGNLTVGGFTASGAAVILSGIATDAANTDATVCRKSSDGTLLIGSGTLGICLGTSSARYKTSVQDIDAGLPQILALPVKSFYLDAEHGDPNKKMYGFIAEDCAKVLPTLTGMDDQGQPNTCDYLGVVPVLVKAVQELSAKVAVLQGGK